MKTPKPPKSNPKKTSIKKPLTKKQKITLIIWALIMTALALFLWLSPPIPDPDRKRFTTLYEDMKYATEQTNDMVEWSEIEKQCSYSPPTNTSISLRGSWRCTVSADDTGKSIASVVDVAKKMTVDGRFADDGVSDNSAILVHQQTSIRCSLSSIEADQTSRPLIFSCADIAKKPWFPPASNSTDESLPDAGAWKRHY